MARSTRIRFLKVPLDIVPEEELETIVRSLLADGSKHQIVLLPFRGLMRARRDKEYRALLENASLVIPVSKSIISGARFLKKPLPVRWMPFEFIIRLLGILEINRKSLYLLGAKAASINTAAANLRASFPGLNIVGRCSGFYKKEHEEDLLLAIRKASPSLLLTANGIKGRDKWLYRHRDRFAGGLYLWDKYCFDIFAGKRKKPAKNSWKMGMEGLPDVLTQPWRIFRIFQYLYYYLLLIVYRIRQK